MQGFNEVTNQEPYASALALLTENDKIIASNNSGNSFPTASLFEGMFCLRMDLMKLFVLTNAVDRVWLVALDFTGAGNDEATFGGRVFEDFFLTDGTHAITGDVSVGGHVIKMNNTFSLQASEGNLNFLVSGEVKLRLTSEGELEEL